MVSKKQPQYVSILATEEYPSGCKRGGDLLHWNKYGFFRDDLRAKRWPDYFIEPQFLRLHSSENSIQFNGSPNIHYDLNLRKVIPSGIGGSIYQVSSWYEQ